MLNGGAIVVTIWNGWASTAALSDYATAAATTKRNCMGLSPNRSRRVIGANSTG
jgi:hypothetical protein